MRYLKYFENNDILYMLKNDIKHKGIYDVLNNDDFELKIDDVSGDHLTLNWIKMKTRKYSGTDILNSLIKYSQEKNYEYISAYGIKGDFKGKPVNGYYTLMRWGFIPDKGVNFINNVLDTKYNSLEEAFSKSIFWENWKKNGTEYTGEFNLETNSLSFKILNKEKILIKIRIHFKYKGSLHKKYHTGTVDVEIEGDEYHGQTKEESTISEATELLSDMISHGLIDVECDHAVDDFFIEKISYDFSEEADFKF